MPERNVESFDLRILFANSSDKKKGRKTNATTLKSDIALPGLVCYFPHKELVKIVSLFRIHKKLLRLSKRRGKKKRELRKVNSRSIVLVASGVGLVQCLWFMIRIEIHKLVEI